MCADAKLDEWKLVLDQFHALVREGSDNIEDIFDIQALQPAQTSHRKREPQRVPSGS